MDKYLQKTKLPISLFWVSSALFLPEIAISQEGTLQIEEMGQEASGSDTCNLILKVRIRSEEEIGSETSSGESNGNELIKIQILSVTHLEDELFEKKNLEEVASASLEHQCPYCTGDEVSKAQIASQKSEPNGCVKCANTIAPLEYFRFYVDWLYFMPIQDTLKYAQTNTFGMGPPYSGPGHSLYQAFEYDSGVRLGFATPVHYDGWEAEVIYTFFHPTVHPVSKTDPGQFIFTTLANSFFPLENNDLNNQCGYAKGQWQLKMDVLDLEYKKLFHVGKSLTIEPLFGVKSSLIRQHIKVEYKDMLLALIGDPYEIECPQKVISKSKVWGVGPDLGFEMRFLTPKKFSILLKGTFACMLGQFDTTTKYTDLLTVSGPVIGSNIIQEKITRLFSVAQVQGSVSKWWPIGDFASLEVLLGWETQVWWRQNRMNWYPSLALPPDGSDLTLQGPFGRISFSY